MQLLSDHDEYLATLHTYNRYWSGYLAITLLELIPLLTTVAYMAFLIELNDKIFRLTFIIFFVEFIVMFTSVFMAVSRASKAAHSCYPHMMSLISPRLDRKINKKILRSASLYETPIGFYCANLFVISYETYFSFIGFRISMAAISFRLEHHLTSWNLNIEADIAGCKKFAFYLKAFTFLEPASKKTNRKWKIYMILSLSAVYICVMKQVMMYFTNDIVKQNYIGDYCRLYTGTRSHQHVCYTVQILFSVSHMAIPVYSWYLKSTKAGRYLLSKVMEPLMILCGQQDCPSYLKDEEIKKLRRQTKLIGRIMAGSAIYAGAVYAPYMTYLFIAEHNRTMAGRSWYYLVPNCILVAVWLHQSMGSVAASFGYFFLITKLMGMRAANFTECLIREKPKIRSHKAIGLLNDNDQYLSTLDTYNLYWSKYMGLMFVIFIPMMTGVSYMAFLLELNDPIFRYAIMLIYVDLCLMFTAICMAASRLSKSVHGCYKHLIGLTSPRLGHEVNLKIMRKLIVSEELANIARDYDHNRTNSSTILYVTESYLFVHSLESVFKTSRRMDSPDVVSMKNSTKKLRYDWKMHTYVMGSRISSPAFGTRNDDYWHLEFRMDKDGTVELKLALVQRWYDNSYTRARATICAHLVHPNATLALCSTSCSFTLRATSLLCNGKFQALPSAIDLTLSLEIPSW
ncbi:hypothetical protein HDE_03444 [Halotydeus destructor]|nr:hypothetical protein HDE_03444 [Halotydeus destructor]